MICLRSGYCCNQYNVVIVDDPDKADKEGIQEDNLKIKPTGVRCQHLVGIEAGKHSCSVHDREWYKETPCFDYGQIEHGNTECRMGRYILDQKAKQQHA